MRRSLCVSLLAATVAFGCGPDEPGYQNVAGNWNLTIATTCQGTMSLSQDNDGAFAGTVACGGMTGTVRGSIEDTSSNAMSATFSVPGYQDALFTGQGSHTRITGTMNGSGFTGESLTAVRQ